MKSDHLEAKAIAVMEVHVTDRLVIKKLTVDPSIG